MRVPNMTMYNTSRHQLGKITSRLKDANDVVSSQKRINSMSDDPVGLSQVIDLKTSIKNLDQIEKNVQMGKTWLTSSETAMDSVNNLILDAKAEVSSLINASATADERNDAVERIDGILEQMVLLGNTKVNGNYIFSGTDTDKIPFVYHKDEDPPYVSYEGDNTPFSIKTDSDATVEVGRDGRKVFEDSEIVINSTNNTIVFKEDNGHGSASNKVMTAVVPDGEYTADALETVMCNVLNEASSQSGYGVKYTVDYDVETKSFSIEEDGSFGGFLRTEFLWKSGKDPYLNDIKTSAGIEPDDLNITVVNKKALTIGTPEPHGADPFRLIWDGDENWIVENNPGYVMPFKISGTADEVNIDLDDNGLSDIIIKLDNPVQQEGEYIEFEIIPEKGDYSIGSEIGFKDHDTVLIPPVSDNDAEFITDITIDVGVNDAVDFTIDPALPDAVLPPPATVSTFAATIAPGNYTDMDTLSQAIEDSMETAVTATTTGTLDFEVSYDPVNSRFNIREDGASLDALHLNWKSGANSAASAASTLGFYSLDDSITYPESDNTPMQCSITIDNSNNMLDFEEIDGVLDPTIQALVSTGTYTSIADLETAVETAMNNASAGSGNSITYDVAYDDTLHQFTIEEALPATLNELHLLWNSGLNSNESIGDTLGFDSADDNGGPGVTSYISDTAPVLMEFDSTNNVIDFRETKIDGTLSEDQKIEIPKGDYTDLDDVAAEIQTALRAASPNSVDYVVSYDYTAGNFMIKGSDADIRSYSLLWETGENSSDSAAEMLGFDGTENDVVTFAESDQDVVNINIDASNNKIDFMEITEGNSGEQLWELTATVPSGNYTDYGTLAHGIEKALEKESREKGSRIDYSVSFDKDTKKFTIKEAGTELKEFRLLWGSGENRPVAEGGTGNSIGSVAGFDAEDDIDMFCESSREVEWSLFNTLIDFKDYLADNDTYGLERTLGRLENHYDNMTSRIVNTGMKYNRLDVRERMTTEVSLSLTERRSMIEDADIIKAIMDLQSANNAYQASLSSTSKVINISLIDYL